MHIDIKKVTINDIAALQKISKETFAESFSESTSEENMRNYLDNGFAADQLSKELSNTGSEFYFSLYAGKVIGYLKVNTGGAQTELQEERALEIERIYVLGEYQGKKVGQLLYDKAIQIAQQLGSDYIWLGVWEENERAIRFYQRNGFVEFNKHLFKLGEDEQTDLMMKKFLKLVNLQPVLESESIQLIPLAERDFPDLYAAASDPAIWAQHPNKDRWQNEVFRTFFDGAMQSGGAFRIVDKVTGRTIGSTRFYDYIEKNKSIFIGYTFYSRECWGKGINPMVKAMMLGYIFQFVDHVYFHVGALNTRSQIAISRLGAVKVDEQKVAYYGEAPQINFVYEITKTSW